MTKKVYKIEGMHCASCAMLIEGELEDAGMKATCSYAKQTLEVEGDESTGDEEHIRQLVRKAGYSVALS